MVRDKGESQRIHSTKMKTSLPLGEGRLIEIDVAKSQESGTLLPVTPIYLAQHELEHAFKLR